MDIKWSDLEKNCKYDARLEADSQGRRGKSTGGLGWRARKKKLGATSINLGRKGRSTRV
jgi:hypothetical protein